MMQRLDRCRQWPGAPLHGMMGDPSPTPKPSQSQSLSLRQTGPPLSLLQEKVQSLEATSWVLILPQSPQGSLRDNTFTLPHSSMPAQVCSADPRRGTGSPIYPSWGWGSG